MTELDILSLSRMVTTATFLITFLMGLAMSRSDFCTMGAVSDVVNLGDWTRLRMWVGAIGVAILGTQMLAHAGLIDLSRSLYTAPRLVWLSHLTGGLMFGFGMVLASGCGTKTLLRIGTGNLKSLVVFIVIGLTAYMTLKGLTAVWRTQTVDTLALSLSVGQDLPRLIAGTDTAQAHRLHLWLGLPIGAAALSWALSSREVRAPRPLLGVLAVGLGVVAVWFVSGQLGFVPEDPNTLEERFVGTHSNRLESLSFVAPIAHSLELLMFWSDQSRTLTLGVASVLGIACGSLAHALLTRSFRWEGFRTAEDTANHLIGATLMGVGGITGLGCTLGQGVSGLSTLAMGSFITFAALILGALAGLRYQIWRVERMA